MLQMFKYWSMCGESFREGVDKLIFWLDEFDI